MTDARAERRLARQADIQSAACRLVVERGFDGFTMDDLAAAVGVSRRTLFNHVPDKASAVLGRSLAHDVVERSRAQFAQAAPSSAVEDDVLGLLRDILTAFEREVPDAVDRHLLVEQAVAADPKLAQLAFCKLDDELGGLVDVICMRQRWVAGDLRARVVAVRTAALLPVVFEEVRRRAGPGSVLQVLDDVVAAARATR